MNLPGGEPRLAETPYEAGTIRGGVAGGLAWLAWLAAACLTTSGYFAWEFRYFQHPGPQFQRAISVLLAAFLAALPAYLWFRRRGWWRYEPAVIGALLLAALLYYRFAAALVALWVLIACCAFGRWVLGRLGLLPDSPGGGIVFAAATGFGALSVVLFPLGLARGYYPAAFAALLGIACALLRRQIAAVWLDLRGLLETWQTETSLRDPLAGVSVVFGAIALAQTAAVVIAPSVAFDALKMHLPAVGFYASSHGLGPVPALEYSYFPQGAELLMTLAFSLAGQAGAQMMPALFFGLTALTGLGLVRSAGAGRLASLVAVAGAVTVPFLHWTGSVVKNDLMLAFFELTALYAWAQWRVSGNFRWIQLATFFVAIGFGIKYTVLFGAIPLALLFLYAAAGQRRRVRAAGSMAAIFVLFGCYWPLRAFILTGNPLYPQTIGQSVALRTAGVLTHPGEHSTASRVLGLIAYIQFSGQRFFESPLACPTGIFLAVAAPAWLLFRKRVKSPVERACLFFAVLYGLYWGSSYIVLRYAIPALFVLHALTVARLCGFYGAARAPLRASVLCAGVYCLLFATLGAAIVEINAPQLRLLAGRTDDRQYLREVLTTYRSLEFLKGKGSPGERIFGLDNCSAAYAPPQMPFTCEFRNVKSRRPVIAAELSSANYGWLVLPADGAAGIVDEFHLRERFEERYRDASFVVLHRVR